MQASLMALTQSRSHDLQKGGLAPGPHLALPCGIWRSESYRQAKVNITTPPPTHTHLRQVLGTGFCIRSFRVRKVAKLVDLSQIQGY